MKFNTALLATTAATTTILSLPNTVTFASCTTTTANTSKAITAATILLQEQKEEEQKEDDEEDEDHPATCVSRCMGEMKMKKKREEMDNEDLLGHKHGHGHEHEHEHEHESTEEESEEGEEDTDTDTYDSSTMKHMAESCEELCGNVAKTKWILNIDQLHDEIVKEYNRDYLSYSLQMICEGEPHVRDSIDNDKKLYPVFTDGYIKVTYSNNNANDNDKNNGMLEYKWEHENHVVSMSSWMKWACEAELHVTTPRVNDDNDEKDKEDEKASTFVDVTLSTSIWDFKTYKGKHDIQMDFFFLENNGPILDVEIVPISIIDGKDEGNVEEEKKKEKEESSDASEDEKDNDDDENNDDENNENNENNENIIVKSSGTGGSPLYGKQCYDKCLLDNRINEILLEDYDLYIESKCQRMCSRSSSNNNDKKRSLRH